MMRCQFIIPGSDQPCVKAGTWKVVIQLPNDFQALLFVCHAHEQAVNAILWAERKREG